jgi:hypothetical protein
LTGLESAVRQLTTLVFIHKTDKPKPVKQVNGTVILPPLVFPGMADINIIQPDSNIMQARKIFSGKNTLAYFYLIVGDE